MHQLRLLTSRPTSPPEAVDYIITMALKTGASDIHLAVNQNPAASDPFLLRFRIFGKLQIVRCDFLAGYYKEVISRFKVLAGMNTTETTTPLDGQIQAQLPNGESIVLRVATVPGQDFEDVTIRLQRSSNTNHTLDSLVMPEDLKARLKLLIRQKSGMIVLNGPAGSGKTTTIYSIIGTLASPERKIITAEDPIESRLSYVNHVQVTPKTSFASLCRSFMRQDADVIFVGEIRDTESAEAAIQLAQTGHLVLTTLHTRDSIGVVSRFEALGIHPNLVATTLIGSLSQRLVPRHCPQCKVEANPDPETLRRVSAIRPPPAGARFLRTGPGCPSCIGGVQGRIAIYELFMIDPELADRINDGAAKSEIAALAASKGMRNLAQDALQRVYEGSVDLNNVVSFVLMPEYAKPAEDEITQQSFVDPDASRVISLPPSKPASNEAAAPAPPPGTVIAPAGPRKKAS